MSPKTTKRVFAGRRIAATTVALSAALALAPMATAQTITGDITGLDPATAASACSNGASLGVTLTGKNPYNEVAEGQKTPGGVQGYTVDIRRVEDVDLGTTAGWDAVRTLTPQEAEKRNLATALTVTTDAQGHATFGDLTPGLYLMTLTAPNDSSHSYQTYKPQLVTVPVGTPASDGVAAGWNCQPIIQPKSEDSTPPKPTDPGKPTDPTKPGEPGKPTEPGEPGRPGQPDKPTPDSPGESTPGGGSLANTGVSILGVLIAGVGLVSLGLILKRRRNEEQ